MPLALSYCSCCASTERTNRHRLCYLACSQPALLCCWFQLAVCACVMPLMPVATAITYIRYMFVCPRSCWSGQAPAAGAILCPIGHAHGVQAAMAWVEAQPQRPGGCGTHARIIDGTQQVTASWLQLAAGHRMRTQVPEREAVMGMTVVQGAAA